MAKGIYLPKGLYRKSPWIGIKLQSQDVIPMAKETMVLTGHGIDLRVRSGGLIIKSASRCQRICKRPIFQKG